MMTTLLKKEEQQRNNNNSNNDYLWKNLVQWIEQSGGYVHPALILQGEGNFRGVFTTRSISLNDILIRLPSCCVVSGDGNGTAVSAMTTTTSKTSTTTMQQKSLDCRPTEDETTSGDTSNISSASKLNDCKSTSPKNNNQSSSTSRQPSTSTSISTSTSASPWLQCVTAYYQAALPVLDNDDNNNNNNNNSSSSQKSKFKKSNNIFFYQPYLQSLPIEYETLFQWTDYQLQTYLGGTTLGTICQLDRKEDMLRTRYHVAVKPHLEQQYGLLLWKKMFHYHHNQQQQEQQGESSNKDNHPKENKDQQTMTATTTTTSLSSSSSSTIQQEQQPSSSSSIDDEQELDFFRQVCMCISTRGFHMKEQQQQDEEKKTNIPTPSSSSSSSMSSSSNYNGPFLLPVIDLLNHVDKNHLSCTTLQRDVCTGMFSMKAEREISRGEEVVHQYGDNLTSAQILQTFGFVPQSYMKDRACSSSSSSLLLSSSSSSSSSLGANLVTPRQQNYRLLTPAVLSKMEHLLPACRRVALSDYPEQLIEQMKSQGLDHDEVWNVKELFQQQQEQQQRSLSHVSNELTISISGDNHNDNHNNTCLTDELITVLCAQFLPEDAYQDVFHQSNNNKDNEETDNTSCLLDRSILEDFFLGHLVCQSVKIAINSKLQAYQPLIIADDVIPDSNNFNSNLDNNNNMEQNNPVTTALDRDQTQLRQLLHMTNATTTSGSSVPGGGQQQSRSSSYPTLNQQRAMYGLTIRIEELLCLLGLQKEILSIEECLDQGYSIESARLHDSHNHPENDDEEDDVDDDEEDDNKPVSKRLKSC